MNTYKFAKEKSQLLPSVFFFLQNFVKIYSIVLKPSVVVHSFLAQIVLYLLSTLYSSFEIAVATAFLCAEVPFVLRHLVRFVLVFLISIVG